MAIFFSFALAGGGVLVLMQIDPNLVQTQTDKTDKGGSNEIEANASGYWCNYAADSFFGGSGTSSDPYLIATPEQLARVSYLDRNDQWSGTLYFKLLADVDMSDHYWAPIGVTSSSRSIDFYGNFCKITGLTCYATNDSNTTTYCTISSQGTRLCVLGFIGLLNPSDYVFIHDLSFSQPDIQASTSVSWTVYAGTVVGLGGGELRMLRVQTLAGTISIKASTSMAHFVGGLVGAVFSPKNNSYMAACRNGTNISVDSKYDVYNVAGGGYKNGASVGGLVGAILNQYASSTCGFTFRDCLNSAVSVSGGAYTGGILGANNDLTESASTTVSVFIYNCAEFSGGTATTVSGGRYVGGLVGYFYQGLSWANNSYMTASFAFTKVTATLSSSSVGALIGYHYAASVKACAYSTYFTSLSAFGSSAGGNTSTPSTVSTYYPTSPSSFFGTTLHQSGYSGWTNNPNTSWSWGTGTTTTWYVMNANVSLNWTNNGTPAYEYWTDSGKYATSFAGGSGTSSSPYLISNGAQLARVAYLVNSGSSSYISASYKLTADINLSGYFWDPIGSRRYVFGGDFDGAGYTIKNLSVLESSGNTDKYYFSSTGKCLCGLFGEIYDYSATVHDFYCENLNICVTAGGPGLYVGLVAYADGGAQIYDVGILSGNIVCPDTSTMYTDCFFGSICGVLQSGGSCVFDCFSCASMNVDLQHTGNYVVAVGGLVGAMGDDTMLVESYANCVIDGGACVAGGLVGDVFSTNGEALIESCYFRGPISVGRSTMPQKERGGLIGRSEGLLNLSTSFSAVTGGTIGGGGPNFSGGLIGCDTVGDACAYNCSWYSGQTSSFIGSGGLSEGENLYSYSSLAANGDGPRGSNFYDDYMNSEWPIQEAGTNPLSEMYDLWGVAWCYNYTSSSASGSLLKNDGFPILTWAWKYFAHYVTVSFNANGGTPTSIASRQVEYLAEFGALPVVTRNNYVFLGWRVGNATTGQPVTSSTPVTSASAITLYAAWEQNSTITYNHNDGTGTTSTQTYNSTSTTTLKSLTRTGYTLAGWKPTATVGTGWTKDTLYAASTSLTGKKGNVTLDAVWRANRYKITLYNTTNNSTLSTTCYAQYDSNKLYSSNSISSSTGLWSSDASAAMPSVTKAGYVFKGWGTSKTSSTVLLNPNGTFNYVSGYTNSSGNWTYTSTMSLYTIWELDTSATVRVNIKRNDGSGFKDIAYNSNSDIGGTITLTSSNSEYTSQTWSTANGGHSIVAGVSATLKFTSTQYVPVAWTTSSSSYSSSAEQPSITFTPSSGSTTTYYLWLVKIIDNQVKYDAEENYYYFEDGRYPQSEVTDTSLANTLTSQKNSNTIKSTADYFAYNYVTKNMDMYSGGYLYGGNYYTCVTLNGTTKWFREDPIRWRVGTKWKTFGRLESGTGGLYGISANILFCSWQQFPDGMSSVVEGSYYSDFSLSSYCVNGALGAILDFSYTDNQYFKGYTVDAYGSADSMTPVIRNAYNIGNDMGVYPTSSSELTSTDSGLVAKISNFAEFTTYGTIGSRVYEDYWLRNLDASKPGALKQGVYVSKDATYAMDWLDSVHGVRLTHHVTELANLLSATNSVSQSVEEPSPVMQAPQDESRTTATGTVSVPGTETQDEGAKQNLYCLVNNFTNENNFSGRMKKSKK